MPEIETTSHKPRKPLARPKVIWTAIGLGVLVLCVGGFLPIYNHLRVRVTDKTGSDAAEAISANLNRVTWGDQEVKLPSASVSDANFRTTSSSFGGGSRFYSFVTTKEIVDSFISTLNLEKESPLRTLRHDSLPRWWWDESQGSAEGAAYYKGRWELWVFPADEGRQRCFIYESLSH